MNTKRRRANYQEIGTGKSPYTTLPMVYYAKTKKSIIATIRTFVHLGIKEEHAHVKKVKRHEDPSIGNQTLPIAEGLAIVSDSIDHQHAIWVHAVQQTVSIMKRR